jgi:hypothetical protein
MKKAFVLSYNFCSDFLSSSAYVCQSGDFKQRGICRPTLVNLPNNKILRKFFHILLFRTQAYRLADRGNLIAL